MSSTSTTTVIGYVARDVTVEHTREGKAFANVTVPHQRSRKNRQTNEWENVGETTWHQATFWDDDAELVAAAVSKGTKVVVTGMPEVYAYAKQDGGASAAVRLLFPTLGVIPVAHGRNGGQEARGGQNSASTDAWTGGGFYGADEPF